MPAISTGHRRVGLVLGLLLASQRGCSPAPLPEADVPWLAKLRQGDALRHLHGRPSFKLTLGGQTRNAIRARTRLVFDLDPAGATGLEIGSALRCAEGAACRGRVKFRVRVTGAGAAGLLQGWTIEANWREENPEGTPRMGEPARWRTRVLPLGQLGHGRIRVQLEAEAEAGSRGAGSEAPQAFWSEPLLLAAARARPNLVLISLDALRPDRLGCYGNPDGLSPHIDRLAAAAVRFESAVSSAPWTTPAHMSLFTGLDPSHHHVTLGPAAGRQRPLAARVRTLAGQLREQGYRTVAVTGGGTVAAGLGFDRGFDIYVDGSLKLTPESRAGVLAQLRAAQPAPFFLFVHSFETHAPYSRKERALGLLTPAALADWARNVEVVDWVTRLGDRSLGPTASVPWRDPAPQLARRRAQARIARAGNFEPPPTPPAPPTAPAADATEALPAQRVLQRHGLFSAEVARALYDGGVQHADTFVGELLEELRRMGLEDNTVVVLTSDHGEEFGEHDPHRFWDSHCVTQYDELMRVPLIVKLPGTSGRVVRPQARLVDVLPTLLDWLELPRPDGLDGRSLLPSIAGVPLPATWALAESTCAEPEVKALRNEEYKYVAEFDPASPPPGRVRWQWLFRLPDDRRELRDLSMAQPELTARLRDHLLAVTRQPARRPPPSDAAMQSADALERLKALGYVQ